MQVNFRFLQGALAQYNPETRGSSRTLASVAYKTGFRSLYLFGETAVSDNGSVATVNGLRFSGLPWM